MKVGKRYLCLLILVPSVKLVVELVFIEKIALGDVWKSRRMDTMEVRKIVILPLFSKTSLSVQLGGLGVVSPDSQLDVDEVSDGNNRAWR